MTTEGNVMITRVRTVVSRGSSGDHDHQGVHGRVRELKLQVFLSTWYSFDIRKNDTFPLNHGGSVPPVLWACAPVSARLNPSYQRPGIKGLDEKHSLGLWETLVTIGRAKSRKDQCCRSHYPSSRMIDSFVFLLFGLHVASHCFSTIMSVAMPTEMKDQGQ